MRIVKILVNHNKKNIQVYVIIKEGEEIDHCFPVYTFYDFESNGIIYKVIDYNDMED